MLRSSRLIDIFHWSFIVFFVSIPLWNLRYLRYGRFLPLLIITLWFVCEGCPLRHADKGMDNQMFATPLVPFLSQKRIKILTYIVLFVSAHLANRRYYSLEWRGTDDAA